MAQDNQVTQAGTPATPAQTTESGAAESGTSSGLSNDTQESIAQQLEREAGERDAVQKFDPFGPAEKPGEKPGGTAGEKKPQDAPDDKGAGVGEKKPAAGAEPGKDGKPTAEATPPPPPAFDPAALQTIIQQNAEAIRRLSEKPDGAGGTPGAPSKDEAKPEAPKFNLGIPPQVLDLIRSEDPKENAQGLHAVINGVANHIWGEVSKHVSELEQRLVQGFPQVIQSHMTLADQQRNVNQDFYGTYKVFNHEAFAPLVQNLGVQVGREWHAAGKPLSWSAEMRDEIAKRLFTMFPAAKVQHDADLAAATGKPNGGNPPAAKKQPWTAGGGGGKPPGDDKKNEFTELLGF